MSISHTTDSRVPSATGEAADVSTTVTTTDYDYEDETVASAESHVISAIAILGTLIVLIVYNKVAEKRKNSAYDCLNLKHVMFSILHAYLIEKPETTNENSYCNSLTVELLIVLEVSVPMWTVCISLKMFTDLYLSVDREDVFSAKDLTIFGYSAITTVHVTQVCFIMLEDMIYTDHIFTSAIRVTAVLFVTSVPITVACVIVKSLCTKSSYIVKRRGLFFFLHLLVYILCDGCLALFIITKTTSCTESVAYVFTELMYYRLVLEIVWFVGSHYLGKTWRIYTEN